MIGPVNGHNNLVLGDCMALMDEMLDSSIDLILTDPPFGTTGLKLDKSGRPPAEAWKEMFRVLKPSGWLFSFGQIPLFMDIARAGFVDTFSYVWIKPSGVLNRNRKKRPAIAHEVIQVYHKNAGPRYYSDQALVAYGNSNYRRRGIKSLSSKFMDEMHMEKSTEDCEVLDGSRSPTTVLRYPNKPHMRIGERTKHPTQKPVEMLAYLIGGFCPPSGTVLDPYAGSGSTLVAAASIGRFYRGAEISEEWYNVAHQRLQEVPEIKFNPRQVQERLI